MLTRTCRMFKLSGVKEKADKIGLFFYLPVGTVRMADARADVRRLETLHNRMGMEAFPGRKSSLILEVPELINFRIGEVPYGIVRRYRFFEELGETIVFIGETGCNVEGVFSLENILAEFYNTFCG